MEIENVAFLERLSVVCQIAGGVPSLAGAAGVSVSAVRKYLAGSEPTRPVLIALARAVGVRGGWLLDGSGSICDPDSVLAQRAKHQIGLEFNAALILPDYRDDGMVGAAKLFAEEYRLGEDRCEWPEWIRLVVPAFSFDEAISWRLGQLDYVSVQTQGSDKTISTSPETIAFIAAAIRRTYGVQIEGLSLGMEAAIFSRACQLEGRMVLPEMPSDMLSKFIHTFAYEFDPKAQGSLG